MSIIWWMDKLNMVFRHKKERSADMCYNDGGNLEIFFLAERKQAQKPIFYDYIPKKSPE